MTIVEFLTARLDESQAAAEAAAREGEPHWEANDERVYTAERGGVVVAGPFGYLGAEGTHIALHDPAWALADVKAKRRLIQEHAVPGMHRCAWGDLVNPEDCPVLRALATIDADHPDYDPAWRP
jgi:hypothetical protein